MTPEKRAAQITIFCGLTRWPEDLGNLIADAIRAAVFEEREACAKLVDADERGEPSFERLVVRQTLAAAIRARKDGA